MNEIRCPKCNEMFKLDESGFAKIVKQVRDSEFEKALNERETLLKETNEAIKKLAINDALKKIEKERDNLKSLLQEQEASAKLSDETNRNKLQATILKQETEIAELKGKLETADISKNLSVKEAVSTVEKERDTLANKLETKDTEMALLESTLKDKYQAELKIF